MRASLAPYTETGRRPACGGHGGCAAYRPGSFLCPSKAHAGTLQPDPDHGAYLHHFSDSLTLSSGGRCPCGKIHWAPPIQQAAANGRADIRVIGRRRPRASHPAASPPFP